MTAFSHARRLGALALALVAAVTACGDGPLLSRNVAGYYRLVSVNGQALPYLSPPSFGPFWHIWRGDLLLRSDGSFMQGTGANLSGVPTGDGTYRLAGSELVFHWRGAPEEDEIPATLSGDSISIPCADNLGRPLHFVFRRAQRSPSAIASEHYRLTSVNGRTGEPLIVYDTIIGDTRYVGRVPFDSLTFLDGLFVRRHRAQQDRAYLASGDSLIGDEEWTIWGAFESGQGWARLQYYYAAGPESARDSLSLVGDTLVRRTPLITGIREERYTSR